MTVEALESYGMVRMTDGEIRGFLNSQSMGVLGLSIGEAPVLRPMSFGYGDESTLYLLFVLADASRKEDVATDADTARFLVYSAETVFNWRSVLLTGTIEPVADDERERALDAVEDVWRPELFRSASEDLRTRLYRFRIEERAGIKHMGLPPAFEENGAANSTE